MLSESEKERLRDTLNEMAKRRQWEEVVKTYQRYPAEAQKLKLTPEGDTALHLAVIDNQEETVEKLVRRIRLRSEHDCKEILEKTSERKSNVLHLAAMMGSARMCHAIASAHEGLVDKRNSAGETPMFLAAVYGNTNAFFCLYGFCNSDPFRILLNYVAYSRDTALHCAIRKENFALAFHIIDLNHGAKNLVNEQGMSALHVLASKPSCFKSGANISGWRKILYNCIPVHQLRPQTMKTLAEAWRKSLHTPSETSFPNFPPNYKTCIQFFTMFSKALLAIFRFKKKVDIEPNGKIDFRDTESQSVGEPLMTKFPPNYSTCIHFFNIVLSTIEYILECGFPAIKEIREKKQKHIWSVQVMEKFLKKAQIDGGGQQPWIGNLTSLRDERLELPDGEKCDDSNNKYEREEVIHLATKNGVIEIMMEIYNRFPIAMRHTTKSNRKNVVHLAAEHRQSDVYKFLLKKKYYFENMFRAVDKDGNSALHLAADRSTHKFWNINEPAIQMQWEVEWYKFVKESMPRHFFALHNKKGETASTIFEESHMDLVQKGNDWIYSTSQSCTIVATLITTVAFATAAIIPGSTGNDNNLVEKEKVSFIFAISSLIALSLSTTSVIMFLAILTAKFDIDDYFGSMFSWKLLIGLSSLYSSIIAMLISFCTGSSYFLINYRFPNKVIMIYTLIFLPVPFILAIVHLPLYYDLLLVFFKIMPKRKVNADLCD